MQASREQREQLLRRFPEMDFSQPDSLGEDEAMEAIELEDDIVNTIMYAVGVDEQGACSIDHLFSRLVKSTKMDFKSAAQLDSYVKARPHIFKYSIITHKVSNMYHLFAPQFLQVVWDVASEGTVDIAYFARILVHREMLTGPSDATRKCVPQQSFDTDNDEADEDGITDAHIHFAGIFLKKFDAVFVYDASTATVSIKEAAKHVPSLWSEECLSHVDKQFRDYSRVYVVVGSMVSSTSHYGKANVTSGPFREQSVYMLGKDIGQSDVHLGTEFPVGCMVECVVVPTFHTANELCAIRVRPYNHAAAERRSRGSAFCYDEQRDAPYIAGAVPIAVLPNASSAFGEKDEEGKKKKSRTREDEERISRILDEERQKVALLNQVLTEYGPQSALELTSKLTQESGLFRLSSDILAFVEAHPHLYVSKAVLEEGAQREPTNDDMKLFLREDNQKIVCVEFLQFLDGYSGFGLSKKDIQDKLKASMAGPRLQDLCIQEGLDGLLEEMSSLLSVHYEGGWPFYQLRGSVYTPESLILRDFQLRLV